MSHLSGFWSFKHKVQQIFNSEQEKESIIHVRMKKEHPSLVINVCHHSASLVMPNSALWDGFFYPTFTLMMDSYNVSQMLHVSDSLYTKNDIFR